MGSIASQFKAINALRRQFRKRLKKRIRYGHALIKRRFLDASTTFVGITGSAGKTTATDLAAAVLAVSGKCQQTHDLNTMDDVALTVLRTGRMHRFCVAELAASGPGSLDGTVRVFRPDIAALTVIGQDHLRAYDGIEGLVAEKEKVVTALPPDGVAVLNIDDPQVRAIGERCGRRVVWYGEAEGADLRLLTMRSVWPEPLTLQVEYKGVRHEVRTRLHGKHMAVPVLTALGIAAAADVPLVAAIAALAAEEPTVGRMQPVDGGGGVTFIRDDFKAPGWSLHTALTVLKDADAARKVAVVGTLSHTSRNSTSYRRFCRIAREAADLVVFVGPDAHRAVRERPKDDDERAVRGFSSIRQAASFLQEELKSGDLVLVKGCNKPDHLIRLILNRETPVQCWLDACEKMIFCNACPRLHLPSEESHPAPSFPPGQRQPVPVFVGLGNPGAEYSDTAHNVGHRVLDAIIRDSGGAWTEEPEGWTSSLDLDGVTVRLLKPAAFMNQNGTMVRRFLERVGGRPEHCILVHDDADLPLGEIRFKSDGGGDGGHKGVRSVISSLETVATPRLRLGIRSAGETGKSGRFVLASFTSGEAAAYECMIAAAAARARECVKNQFVEKASEAEALG